VLTFGAPIVQAPTAGSIQVPAGRADVGGGGGAPILEIAVLAVAGAGLLGAGTVVIRRR
jgi:hypothetical protein